MTDQSEASILRELLRKSQADCAELRQRLEAAEKERDDALRTAQGAQDALRMGHDFARDVSSASGWLSPEVAQRVREALEDLAEAGEEAWGPERPCVKVGRAALALLERP